MDGQDESIQVTPRDRDGTFTGMVVGHTHDLDTLYAIRIHRGDRVIQLSLYNEDLNQVIHKLVDLFNEGSHRWKLRLEVIE